MKKQTRLLLVTDFYYQAKGREYFKEDLELSGYLRKNFKVLISHIDDVYPVMNQTHVVLVRNTGPKSTHQESLDRLKKYSRVPLSNDLQGKGDMRGKQHLLELYKLGYPVIPTVDSVHDLDQLGQTQKYLIKPKNGCDSTGVQILSYQQLITGNFGDVVIQPLLDFKYEVSFYFVDDIFQYAFYAPDKSNRWKLELYSPSAEDLHFAQKMISWNSCRFGIQRVDACRVSDGSLALMELEDYNPYLSLSLLPYQQRNAFLEALVVSLNKQIDSAR